MSGWGTTRFFFPLDRQWEKHSIYQRQPDRDIALLLMRDAHVAGTATVRFSYPVMIERTAWWEGNERRRYGRKAIRNALQRLYADSFLTQPEPGARRAQGRAQGYFEVEICNFARYRLEKREPEEPDEGSGAQGEEQGRGQAGHERGTVN